MLKYLLVTIKFDRISEVITDEEIGKTLTRDNS